MSHIYDMIAKLQANKLLAKKHRKRPNTGFSKKPIKPLTSKNLNPTEKAYLKNMLEKQHLEEQQHKQKALIIAITGVIATVAIVYALFQWLR